VHGNTVRINNVSLDSGPKTYNALAGVQDNYHRGSTRLHKDLTDAVNVMLWAAEFAKDMSGCALWHIFPAAASCIINEFLRREGFTGLGDLIHLQQVCLTPALLHLLFEQTGVRPWTILQHPGDAVYIPAGCAHQVRLSFALSCKYEWLTYWINVGEQPGRLNQDCMQLCLHGQPAGNCMTVRRVP
jgi:lysine-specific demethylase 3